MADSNKWLQVCQLIAETGGAQSPEFPKLYNLAMKDGSAILRGEFPKLRSAEIEEFVHSCLIKLLQHLVGPDRVSKPRAYFKTSLVRVGIDHFRKKETQTISVGLTVVSDDGEETVKDVGDDGFGASRIQDGVDAQSEVGEWLALLSAKERQVVFATHAGENRESIANALGTTRANVDQILSRARKKRPNKEKAS